MSEGNAAAAAKAGAPDPLLGRVIADRFKIVSLIARGGMGKVYRAEQAPLGRVCAVKILNPNYTGDADPEFHRRFFREASTAARITHPNSVTIFDYGKTDDDIYYMAMEYLEGQTLHMAIRQAGTLPEERVGRIGQQICRALREAHALEVIHRDLKPANIFLTRHGDGDDFVKVLDFGLVKHLSERPEEQLTQTGLFMGSPKYMAPEQIQGGHVDARTDIYSLGIMMYEMLTGKVPFERPTSVNILMAHVGEPPPPMRAVNPSLVCTPVFEELVMRCIAKDPNERFSSMDEVLQAIKRAHGVSLTGQLTALNSGGWSPLSTIPPPVASPLSGGSMPPSALVSGSVPAAALPMRAQAASSPPSPSGEQIPLGLLRGSAVADTGSAVAELRPRSRAWLLLGLVGAAALGGVLGMAVWAVQSRLGGRPPVVASSASSVAAAPTVARGAGPALPAAAVVEAPKPAGRASAAPSAAPEVASAITISTEPRGAFVREDGVELCAATPCEVTLRVAAGGAPEHAHKLVITKAGYRIETRTVRAGDAPLSIKLTRSAGAPQGGHSQGASRPQAETPNPEGYKDVPY